MQHTSLFLGLQPFLVHAYKVMSLRSTGSNMNKFHPQSLPFHTCTHTHTHTHTHTRTHTHAHTHTYTHNWFIQQLNPKNYLTNDVQSKLYVYELESSDTRCYILVSKRGMFPLFVKKVSPLVLATCFWSHKYPCWHRQKTSMSLPCRP